MLKIVWCCGSVLVGSLLWPSSFCSFLVFFFFSSRRRHTRSLCDWSSDVCSSDLVRCLAGRDAGEVSNNSGHSTTMLQDVAGIDSDTVEVGFFSNGFPQSQNSEE